VRTLGAARAESLFGGARRTCGVSRVAAAARARPGVGGARVRGEARPALGRIRAAARRFAQRGRITLAAMIVVVRELAPIGGGRMILKVLFAFLLGSYWRGGRRVSRDLAGGQLLDRSGERRQPARSRARDLKVDRAAEEPANRLAGSSTTVTDRMEQMGSALRGGKPVRGDATPAGAERPAAEPPRGGERARRSVRGGSTSSARCDSSPADGKGVRTMKRVITTTVAALALLRVRGAPASAATAKQTATIASLQADQRGDRQCKSSEACRRTCSHGGRVKGARSRREEETTPPAEKAVLRGAPGCRRRRVTPTRS